MKTAVAVRATEIEIVTVEAKVALGLSTHPDLRTDQPVWIHWFRNGAFGLSTKKPRKGAKPEHWLRTDKVELHEVDCAMLVIRCKEDLHRQNEQISAK